MSREPRFRPEDPTFAGISKMHLTISPRFRIREVVWSLIQLWVPELEFWTEFGYWVGLVGSTLIAVWHILNLYFIVQLGLENSENILKAHFIVQAKIFKNPKYRILHYTAKSTDIKIYWTFWLCSIKQMKTKKTAFNVLATHCINTSARERKNKDVLFLFCSPG